MSGQARWWAGIGLLLSLALPWGFDGGSTLVPYYNPGYCYSSYGDWTYYCDFGYTTHTVGPGNEVVPGFAHPARVLVVGALAALMLSDRLGARTSACIAAGAALAGAAMGGPSLTPGSIVLLVVGALLVAAGRGRAVPAIGTGPPFGRSIRI